VQLCSQSLLALVRWTTFCKWFTARLVLDALASHRRISVCAFAIHRSAQRDSALFTFYEARRLCWQAAPLIIGDDNAEDAPSFPRDPLTECARCGRNERRQTQIFEKTATKETLFVSWCRRWGCARRGRTGANATHSRRAPRTYGRFKYLSRFVHSSHAAAGKVGAAFLRMMTRGEWTSRVVTNCHFYSLSPIMSVACVCLPAHV